MPHPTSTEIARRIEELYGAPLAGLHAHVRDQPPGMLSALLGMHHDLVLAERSIVVHRDRLAQLIQPERQINAHEVSHVLDCARRLAEAVAVRDVQTTAAAAVVQSLGRACPPEPSPAPTPAAPAPAAPAVSAAPGR
ncbi:hypothetical protein AQI95_29095 [Streptomyces yokosukanensis]|uniref:Uncharacterized protein n=1 Tax=Streptomyces yokosukanensis TaxID=67386 RepID=A0A101NZF6_9ACTN|nr:hypothetical protein [Streptomyces yokosukanensis]KUN02130.1 hypothetical protein AQI95_29095 [Streptomyces yokosukanensis]